jgi:hypothetical protein
MANEIKRTVRDAGDAIKEGIHRGKAGAEHETRSEMGDVMTPGEKAGSMAREVSEETKAEIDKTKRKVRDSIP